MNKVLAFGEILLRLSPEMKGSWIRNAGIPAFIGGAELNVATALANWQVPVAYCSAMPENAMTLEIDQYLREKNIDTSPIQYTGERIGIYMLPQGADLKNSGVIYDRAHSSFSGLKPGEINWDKVLEGVSWFHFSAISPALNEDAAQVCLEALKAASNKGIFISVDLNFRAKLWKYGKKPVEVMPELLQYCDLVMGNIWAANTLLGIDIDENVAVNKADKQRYLQHSLETSEAIIAKFPKCKIVANTFRFDAFESGILYYTTLYKDGQLTVSEEFTTEKVIDKVGSGDCFMGGLIYGLYHNHPSDEVINFAAAAAFGKLNEYGDATSQTIEDVEQLLTIG